MGKKLCFILVLASLLAGVAMAEGKADKPKKKNFFSFGAGIYIANDADGGVIASTYEGNSITFTGMQINSYLGGGGYFFFDAKYAELSLGFFGANGKSDNSISRDDSLNSISYLELDWENTMSYKAVDFGFSLKLPFGTSKFSIFPLFGINYRLMFAVMQDSKVLNKPFEHSALWLQGGGGLDFSINPKMFVRFEGVYGFRLSSKAEREILDLYARGSKLPGCGITVKLAAGYKF